MSDRDVYQSGTEMARRHSWVAVLVLGLVFVGLGLVLLIWPDRTINVLVIVLGIWLLVFGFLQFVLALASPHVEGRWVVALLGALGVLAGLFILREPFRTVQILVVILGLYWILAGLVGIFGGWSNDADTNRGLSIGAGVISIIAGLALLLWPAPTLLVVAVISGLSLIAIGIMQVVIALRVRTYDHDAVSGAA